MNTEHNIEEKIEYTVCDMRFIVTPVFRQDKEETITKILLNLIKSDIENKPIKQ